ncbi:YibE/F family protein [Denitrovibrio acetiphilus DSM 12809]|uniref:YibE/F family protein n=1 Tax=Denitrovibrio acetiphilus (strain DSM 12809 / NBRC 114555 / N2460) TaxID=522772 RepID=D4H630_DENA2|nr:YibE/F family protein [Denitrovibrio acetiphilus]ADD67676.1 YibE/F family protein [Denitrovibrio acetiphilus DSM 12809]
MKRLTAWIIVSALIATFIILTLYNHPLKKQDENLLYSKGVVTNVDNDDITTVGISSIGFQLVDVLLTEGDHKGKSVTAKNDLLGQLDVDEVYRKGDNIVLVMHVMDDIIHESKTLNRNRQGNESLLFGIFLALLLIYAGFTGLKAMFSFVASLFILWRFLIPALLRGEDPLLYTIITLTLLTVVIIYSVAGFNRKALAAVLGTLTGLAIAISLTLIFGERMMLFGHTAPFASTLLFSGYIGLDMRGIFYAAVIIGASGAAMDIAMDVSAAMYEVKEQSPDIPAGQLIKSGLNVGRTVVGTMTTTLLLAYSGGYLTMLMLFVAKNSSFIRILNMKMVAAEIFRTLVGSIGLVMVAPVTAVIAGWLFTTVFAKSSKKQG